MLIMTDGEGKAFRGTSGEQMRPSSKPARTAKWSPSG
jgi:hypothetical protein